MIIRDINTNKEKTEQFRLATSADGYVPPVDDTQQSADGYVPPVDDTQQSADGYVPPVDDTQQSADGYVPPADDTSDNNKKYGGKQNDNGGGGGGGGYTGDKPISKPPDLSKNKGYEFYGYYYNTVHAAGAAAGMLLGGIAGYKLGNVYIGLFSGLVLGFGAAVMIKKPAHV